MPFMLCWITVVGVALIIMGNPPVPKRCSTPFASTAPIDHHSVGPCRKRRDRQDGRAKGLTIPLFFGNFLLKLSLLT